MADKPGSCPFKVEINLGIVPCVLLTNPQCISDYDCPGDELCCADCRCHLPDA